MKGGKEEDIPTRQMPASEPQAVIVYNLIRLGYYVNGPPTRADFGTFDISSEATPGGATPGGATYCVRVRSGVDRDGAGPVSAIQSYFQPADDAMMIHESTSDGEQDEVYVSGHLREEQRYYARMDRSVTGQMWHRERREEERERDEEIKRTDGAGAGCGCSCCRY